MEKKMTDRKYFQIVAEIDYLKWEIVKASEALGKIKPKSPIVAMIGRACGYKEPDVKEIAQNVAFALKRIATLKKRIDIDATLEKKELAELEKFLSN